MLSYAVAPARDQKSSFLSLLRHELGQHRLLMGLVFTYVAVVVGLNAAYGKAFESEAFGVLIWKFAKFLPGMLYFLLMWRVSYMRLYIPKAEQKGWLRADLKRAWSDPRRIAAALVAVPLMTLVMISFGLMKRLIPIINPFSWDQTFIWLDQKLHFGIDPWQIAHTLAGNPYVITFVTACYNFWLFLMYFSLVFACFSIANRRARMQYLVGFVLTWAIGGNLVATVFSSAGPVYVQDLGLGDHFVPLMRLLQDHAATQPLTVLDIQRALWELYDAPHGVSGISAFPSMHVASTTLMALYAARYNRRFGQIMIGFTAIIMLGSVLLAWHYAVDGYAGALIALACWWMAGHLCRRFDNSSASCAVEAAREA